MKKIITAALVTWGFISGLIVASDGGNMSVNLIAFASLAACALVGRWCGKHGLLVDDLNSSSDEC